MPPDVLAQCQACGVTPAELLAYGARFTHPQANRRLGDVAFFEVNGDILRVFRLEAGAQAEEAPSGFVSYEECEACDGKGCPACGGAGEVKVTRRHQ